MHNDALYLALTVFAALLSFQAISYFQVYRNRRKIIRSNGCRPAPHYPHKVPFLGMDIVREHQTALDQHCYMENMKREFVTYGRTWQFTNFGGEVIHTMDPVIIESAVSRDAKNWGVAPIRYRGGKPFLGAGIFTLDGPPWKHARNQIKPALARSQFSNFHILEFHIRRFLDLVPKDGTTFDLSAITTRLVSFSDNVMRGLSSANLCFDQMIDFSTEYFLGESLHSLAPDPSDKAQRLLASLEICLEGTFLGISQSMFFGRLAAFFVGSQEFRKACNAVHSFVRERMREAIKGGVKNSGRVVLMNELVHDTTDEKLILSTATTFYSAGTDTSSIAIATALFLLSRHPSALAKARAEVLAMATGPPHIDTLKKMHYVRAVIDESKPPLHLVYVWRDEANKLGSLANTAYQRCVCIRLDRRLSGPLLMILSYLQEVA